MATMTEIYEHRTKIYRHICSLLKNELVAEELTDRVIDKAQKYPYDATKSTTLRTWLNTITNSVVVDFTRTRKDVYSVSAFVNEEGKEIFDFEGEDANDVSDNRELREKIFKAFAGLKPKYKRIANLYFMHDRSYEEIATICNIPMGTVKGMISRCRAMLQSELKAVRTM